MKIRSTRFEPGAAIPREYTCEGVNVSPELVIEGVPADAKSLVLIMDDEDAMAGVWHHWVVWNIAPDIESIEKGKAPLGAAEGKNSFGKGGYGGPCPHKGKHRYFFYLYALDILLDLPTETTKEELEIEMVGHVLDKASMFGIYKKEGV